MSTMTQRARYEQAASLLPHRLRRAALALADADKEHAEELRLRTGQPLTVLTDEGETPLGTEGDRVVLPEDIEEMIGSLTEYSRYASLETLRRGYLSVRGGFRLGLCGTLVLRSGEAYNMKDFSSVALRIVCQRIGLAEPIVPQLFDDAGRLCSTLILAPPGGGKTTLLRDLIRSLSQGGESHLPLRVGVIDERSELAVCWQGRAQMELGSHTDVLDACPKAVGIGMLLRGMNPEVIALDELAAEEDIQAVCTAANCGVSLLSSIHAGSTAELRHKPLYRALLEACVFSRAVVIQTEEGKRRFTVEKLPCGPSAAD